MDLQAFENALVRQPVKLVYSMPTFHNPTGITMDLQSRKRLLKIAMKHRIPVIEDEDGSLSGAEAVIDKDYSSALLARKLQADLFLISTAIEKVALNYQKPGQIWVDHLTTEE